MSIAKQVILFCIMGLLAVSSQAKELETVPSSMVTSVIKGRVLDEEGNPLPGAHILVLNVDKLLGTTSDVDGYFLITGVPVGQQRLQVTYLGFQDQIVEVDVQEGLVTEVEVTLQTGILEGEEILVIGERLRGQAKALNQQKTNDNITNIISIDQVAKFPDSNIGDALKRVPGIVMQNDQGEARNIIIRGLGPDLTSIKINGERVSSAEHTSRRTYLDIMPANMVQSVEVYKTVTPDMDGDATGGVVNLVTRMAPHQTSFSATLNSGYSFIEDEPITNGSAVLGTRLLNDKLGIIVSGSLNIKDYGSHNIEADWDLDDQNQPYLDDFQIRRYLLKRNRKGITGTLDYKLSPTSSITFKSSFNHRVDLENRFRERVRSLEPVDENGVSNVEYRFATKTGDGEPQRRDVKKVTSLLLEGNHLLGNRVALTWSANYGRATRTRLRRDFKWRVRGIDVLPDISDPEQPTIAPVNLADLDPTNVTLREIQQDTFDNHENDYRGKLDLKIPFHLGNNEGSLKFGAKYQKKDRQNEWLFIEFEPLDEDAWENVAQHPTFDPSTDGFLAGDYRYSVPFTDREYGSTVDLFNPSLFEAEIQYDEFIGINYDAEEIIGAGYVMFSQSLGDKFKVITGVRVENTTTKYGGFEFVEDTDEITPIPQIKNTYTSVLPSLNLRYNPSNNTVFRLAGTTTIIRPSYGSLNPSRNVNLDDQELSLGNPDLKAARAMNLDLIGERYFESIGLISVSLFYKRIDDFIFRTVQNFSDPNLFEGLFEQVTQPKNGDAATVLGFEAAFQRRLDFLPGALKNLHGFFNFSFAESEVNGIEGREDETLPLQDTAGYTLNGSLSYETNDVVVTASINYTNDYLDSYGDGTYFDRYYDSQTFVDVSATYRVSPFISVFFDANNLTNQPLRFYQGKGRSEQIAQLEYYGRTVNLGVKVNL